MAWQAVRQWQTRLYDQLGTAINHNPNTRKKSAHNHTLMIL